MASGSAGPDVLTQLNTLFRFGVVGDLSDGQLVQRFLTARDGADRAAFTAMVDRHGPMVLGVCREVLGNSHDAQDAFQATFLVLARRAGAVRNADSLASWLHGVALRVALRARSQETRRRIRERQIATVRATHARHQEGPAECWPELHEEIARLPERYRELVVLYYLEGLTTEEAALRVGCPVGTVLSRLSRARDRLRRRLDSRGLACSAALPAAGAVSRSQTLPATWIDTTVQAVFRFVGREPGEAVLAPNAATTLANGVLQTTTLFKLTILVVAALGCGIAWGGLQTSGQNIRPVAANPPQAGPRELALSTGRNALDAGEPPPAAKAPAARFAEALQADTAEAVNRLADALKRNPARLSPYRGFGCQSYMLDLVAGGTTRIGDEILPDQVSTGMPLWSHDGSRIVFDVSGEQWPLGHVVALEARDGMPAYTDLGPGNCPAFSPDDRRIAFALYPDAVPGEETGIWIMHADGSGRRRVGQFGAPFWSPDGREFLINSYTLPTRSTVINLDTKEGGELKVAGRQIFSWPRWAGPGTLVSALATDGEPDAIALLDVREPGEAKIINILWERGNGLDVIPRWPLYQPEKRRCIFAGEEPTKRSLYSLQLGESLRATPMNVVEHQGQARSQHLSGMSFSPDGRYLVFAANRPTKE